MKCPICYEEKNLEIRKGEYAYNGLETYMCFSCPAEWEFLEDGTLYLMNTNADCEQTPCEFHDNVEFGWETAYKWR